MRYAGWANDVMAKLDAKLVYGVKLAKEHNAIPYSAENGAWTSRGIGWWTNGFWPAEMLQMYMQTGDALYMDEAARAENMLDAALANFKELHHDVGFMWLISSGARYALTGDKRGLDRVMFAGNMLAGRYNPNGFVRAWNDAGDGARAGWSIIDTMMNLPLLYTMSELTRDARFMLMAKTHAETAIDKFIKPDGSCYHIVCFDPLTGEALETPAGQGCAPGSSWSRGQAWAVYGFTLSYLYTRDIKFLRAARRVADYCLAHMPQSYLVPVDFMQPAEPDIRDDCAGGILACGLIELTRALIGTEADAADAYYESAYKLLKAMDEHDADYTLASPALFSKCTGAYHDPKSIHIPIIYGDYYFIEGVRKLAGETRLLWKPLDMISRGAS